jgi:KAP-like P-loop domain-containing protein/TIR domain-containing protein
MAEATNGVYLSYSRSDRQIVDELRSRLQERGVEVSLDPMSDPSQQLAGVLLGSRSMVFCIGPTGLGRGQLAEIGAAATRAASDHDFRFFALLLPGAAVSAALLPPPLAERQWVDFSGGLEDEDAWRALLAALAVAPAAESEDRPPASASVRGAAAALTGDVTAAQLVAELLKIHPEYGERRGADVHLDLEEGERATAEEWLRRVRALLAAEEAKELHGRLLVVGLARLDEALRAQLEQGGFLAAVEREIWEPLSTLFAGEPVQPEETVPTHTDNPAIVDELNREGIARILGRRVRDTRAREAQAAKARHDNEFPFGRSFLVHIHGPWGIGKTSLLNFLREELHPKAARKRSLLQVLRREPRTAAPRPWVVVTFNAWQHQRLVPPWWWLMSGVYRQGFHELWKISPPRALLFRGREWFWRAKGGWPGYLMLLAGAALTVLVWRLGFFGSFDTGKTLSLDTVKGLVVGVAAIVTPFLVIFGAARSAGRWLLTTSARGARVFLDNSRDPMEATKNHFTELVDWLGYPVLILVDDLDRCKAPYVVELLEGIQTLFRDVPVTYVVAADRDWLADSYASEYGSFVSVADEPGRPLGYLFLEKTFQLTLSVPAMAPTTRDFYWRGLIRPTRADDQALLQRARKEAEGGFAGLKTEEAVRAELAANPGTTALEQRARLEEAAIQLATPMLEQAAEHVLQPFRPLLDANPRAMKRLVNAYGLARGIELLSAHVGGGKDAQHRTALWTILSLRWPRLAEYLAAHPEAAAHLAKGKAPTGISAELKPLFHDERVKAVIRGGADGVQATLDPDSIRLSVSA